EVVLLQDRCWHFFFTPVLQSPRHGFLTSSSQTGGLRLPATFGNSLGEIGKQHGEPEPDRQLSNETAQGRLSRKDSNGGERRAHHGHKHDRVLDHQPRVELLERVNDRRAGNVPVEKRRSFLLHTLKAVKKVFPGG